MNEEIPIAGKVDLENLQEPVVNNNEADLVPDTVGAPGQAVLADDQEKPELIHIPLQLDDGKLQNNNQIINDQEVVPNYNTVNDTVASTSQQFQNPGMAVTNDSDAKRTDGLVHVTLEEDDGKLQDGLAGAGDAAPAGDAALPIVEDAVQNNTLSDSFQSQQSSSLSSNTPADHDVFVNIHQDGEEEEEAEAEKEEEEFSDPDALIIDVDVPSTEMKDDVVSLHPPPGEDFVLFPLFYHTLIPCTVLLL